METNLFYINLTKVVAIKIIFVVPEIGVNQDIFACYNL